MENIKIRAIQCKTAIGNCGFPEGGLAINPYVGCGHGCVYCYARFMKRFTGHMEKWGTFIDVKMNIAEVLEKQMSSSKYQGQQIYLGTVTDPYQPVEQKYQLSRKILKVLRNYLNPVEILTKSDLVLRDLDLLKQFKEIGVSFTINTLDKKWKNYLEPYSSSVEKRLQAAKKLVKEKIPVSAMMGPCWPIFTDPEVLFEEFKKAGISQVFSESLNTIGGNWLGVEKVLNRYYPDQLPMMREIFFDKKRFFKFYSQAQDKIKLLAKKYRLPVTIYFGIGHAG